MSRPEDYIIEDIINNSQVTALFQPMIFIKKKRVAAYRVFFQGSDGGKGVIDADALVSSADRLGLVLQIERLFRKKSLEGFSFFHRRDKNILLSVSVSSRAILGGLSVKSFLTSLKDAGIDPSNIIIELVESDFEDTRALAGFTMALREAGFMIALDKLGTGSSNWDRIALVKPHLLRLSSPVINGVRDDFFKQEVSRSLISLAHKAGALVIADGIENCDDALRMAELDADILQGDFFSAPGRPENIRNDDISMKIVKLSQRYKEHLTANRLRARESLTQNMAILDGVITDILTDGMHHPDDTIAGAVTKYSSVECIYILDENGIQITNTVLNGLIHISGVGRIFHPDSIYSDQSNKEYYLNLMPDIDFYISEPYISAATGNVCITMSKRYVTADGDRRILCVDLTA